MSDTIRKKLESELAAEGEALLDNAEKLPYNVSQPTTEVSERLARYVIERPTGLTRKRVGFTSSKLSVNVDRLTQAGWYCHWINDYPGRVQNLIDLGYRFVSRWEVEDLAESVGLTDTDLAERVCRRVGTNENGSELLAYLMKTSKEIHEENMRQTQEPCDRIDAQIRSGAVRQSAGVEGETATDAESNTAFYRQVNYRQTR